MLKRALSVVVGGVVLAGVAGPLGLAMAQVEVDHPAEDLPGALIVFPLVMVDQNATIDTVIQISNAEGSNGENEGAEPTPVHCFYVDSACQERNWSFDLTPAQPTGWTALQGGAPLFISDFENNAPAVPLDAQGRWLGELKCYVSNGDPLFPLPVPRNNLVGAATIYNLQPGQALDVVSYNGIGLRAVPEDGFVDDQYLCLGDVDGNTQLCPVKEYVPCGSILLLDQRFDVYPKADYSDNSSLTTSLTVVPCTENIGGQVGTGKTLQMLVYNEFEQRFSLSKSFSCRLDSALRDLTFVPVFSAAVQGTLVGQTRIRASDGHGLLAIATEKRTDVAGNAGSAAYHLAESGTADQDIITVFQNFPGVEPAVQQ